jgi:hypothetical protein
MAMCSAALKPPLYVWDRFVKYVKARRDKGEMTTEEAVATVASDLTDNSLSHLTDFHDDPDSTTLSEIVDRVKASYSQDADRRIAEIQRRAAEEIGRSQDDARGHATNAAEQLRRSQLLLDVLRARANRWARLTANVLFWSLTSVIAYGVAASTYGVSMPTVGAKAALSRAALAAVVLLALASGVWGIALVGIRAAVETRIAASFRRFLLRDVPDV